MVSELLKSTIIESTRQWVETVIVKYNFCPFARKELESGTINYVVSDSARIDDVIELTLAHCKNLDDNPQVATSLLILPQEYDDFDRYLDLVDVLQSQIIDPDYEGIYQLASFHPDYCFADSDKNDAANYTNRSPFPTVHLIREGDITKALETYPDPHAIPDRNMALARRKGSQKMAELLAACHKPTT